MAPGPTSFAGRPRRRRAWAALLLALTIAACSHPAAPDAAPARTRAADRAALAARLDALLRGFERDGFSGAVMVARDGELVLARGYGLADRERAVPAGERTLFQPGSVSKQFTAAAILRLQMQGRVRVGDSIARHLDDVPADKRAITLHHLLTHTSGLPDRASECSSAVAGMAREAYVRHVLAAPLRSPPGRRFHYSNDGYALLGAVVERVSGQPFERYLREQLFGPAGMTRTGYDFDAGALADAARAYGDGRVYLGNLNPRLRNETGPAWCNRASGGMLTTAEDMFRWYRALRGTGVLSAQAKAALWTPHVPETPTRSTFHGYGWTLTRESSRGRLAMHDGSLSGYYTAELRWYFDRDTAIFVAASDAARPAQDIAPAIVRALFAGRR